MTIQELCDIALRHRTEMAVAMVAACVERAYRTGEPLVVVWPDESVQADFRARASSHDEVTEDEWRRLVERNGDTRWHHL